MNDEELTVVLEELGDCLEDMARAVDRMRTVMKRMFRAVQGLNQKNLDIAMRLQALEDVNTKERLEGKGKAS